MSARTVLILFAVVAALLVVLTVLVLTTRSSTHHPAPSTSTPNPCVANVNGKLVQTPCASLSLTP
jgi:hypothetical protein